MNENEQNTIILGKNISIQKRFLAFFSIIIIYFFYCYNFMTGTFIRPTMIKAIEEGGFGFTLTQASSIFAILSFGTIPGTLFFGWLTSVIGKKRTLITVALFISITTYFPLLSPTNFVLWRIARLSAGFSLGGVFGTAMPLVMDMFAAKYRGKLAAILTSTFSLAMMFGGFIFSLLGAENWYLLIMTAVIPPVIGSILVFFLVPDDLKIIQEAKEKLKKENKPKVSYLSMYQGKYLWIGLGVILLSGINFSGYSAFSNNATTYLTTVLGMSSASAGAIYSLQGLGQLLGYNFWGFISDTFGRRMPFIGILLAALLIFIYINLPVGNNTLYMVLSFLLGLTFGFSGGWGAYYTELFPKKFSGLAPGISFNGGRIISTFSLPIIATIGTAFGMSFIFYIVIVVFILGGILWFFLPETLGKERED